MLHIDRSKKRRKQTENERKIGKTKRAIKNKEQNDQKKNMMHALREMK